VRKPLKLHFTLIELVVAIAIVMVVFITAASTLMAVQHAWRNTVKHSDRLRTLIMIDKVVNSSFRNIVPFKWKDEEDGNRQIFLGDADRIIFATTHRVNSTAGGGLRFMMIQLENHSLVATYKKIPMLYWDENTLDGDSEVLAANVESVQFIFGDLDKKREVEWLDEWDEETEKGIPMAIQMKINWMDGTSNIWLRRTAASSKRTNFGKKYYPDRTGLGK